MLFGAPRAAVTGLVVLTIHDANLDPTVPICTVNVSYVIALNSVKTVLS